MNLITDPITKQIVLNYIPRTKLKLSEIERLIRKNRIIVPCPSRQTLVNMCEDGTFETVGDNLDPKPTSFGWLVYEDSFWRWARALDGTDDLPIS